MMNGKQKLYFLLNRINDVREIIPSDQALIINPTKDLNRKYEDTELERLFAKLEVDIKVLKILQAPKGINIERFEELDPDDPPFEHNDGCWHIKLLSSFDDYYLDIQQEPEYQEFTGRKPANTPVSKDGLMTYEQKLELIVNSIVEAKKATRKDQPTTLYINSTNGLDRLAQEEVRNMLLQLQDEGAFKLNPKTNRLLPIERQPRNPGYFLLEDIEKFDDWYGYYLLNQQSKLHNLDWLNLLKIIDVCSDIDQRLQIARDTKVAIPSFPYPYIGRFLELFPFDTVGTRKNYQHHRWEGAQYLQKEKIISELRYNNDDMLDYGSMVMRVNLAKFYEFYRTIKAEFEQRKASFDNKVETPIVTDHTAKEEVVWPDDFKWDGKSFVFGKYGSVPFTSEELLMMNMTDFISPSVIS